MSRHGENIYKRKDGRYEGRYVVGRDERGRTRFGYVYGRQYAAVRRELNRRKAARQTQACVSSGVSLGAYMARWLDGEIRLRVKPSTYATYCRCVSRHIAPVLGGVDIARLTADDARGLAAQLYRKGLAPGTVRSAVRLLSSALESAADDGLIRRNPCRRLRLAPGAQAEQRVLSPGEQSAICRAAKARCLPALLALYTGMRLGEICALQWQDIDFEKKTVAVRRTAQRIARTGGGEGTYLMIGAPKSLRSCRVIPVPDFLLDLLRAQSVSGEFIFGGLRPAEPRTIQRRFARLCRGLSLSGVHFHTLRHTFATRLIELGVDVKTVSALLGHSSARTTLDFYAHSLLSSQRAAIDKLCGNPLSHG